MGTHPFSVSSHFHLHLFTSRVCLDVLRRNWISSVMSVLCLVLIVVAVILMTFCLFSSWSLSSYSSSSSCHSSETCDNLLRTASYSYCEPRVFMLRVRRPQSPAHWIISFIFINLELSCSLIKGGSISFVPMSSSCQS